MRLRSSDLIRRGARQILAQAVEAELQEFLGQYQDHRDEQGRQVVLNGYLPERTIITGVEEVAMNGSAFWSSSGSPIKDTRTPGPQYGLSGV